MMNAWTRNLIVGLLTLCVMTVVPGVMAKDDAPNQSKSDAAEASTDKETDKQADKEPGQETDKQAAKQPAKTALQFIHGDDLEIAEFLKKNKCIIGSWELKKETKFGWEGNLHYACANHRPGGVRFMEGPFKVLKPKGFNPPLTEKFEGFGNEVILRESKKEGYHEIVAFVVPIDKTKGKRWMEGVGDLDWAGIYQKKYRYEGMVKEALAILQSDEAAKHIEATRVLFSLGTDAVEALPTLIERTTKSKDEPTREAAVRAVARVGYDQLDKTMPALIASLSDKSIVVRTAAAQSIAFQGNRGKAAIDALIKATADQSKDMRIEAVRALAHLGVGEPHVILHLEKLAKGDDVAVARAARTALQKIESDTPQPEPDTP